MKIIIAPDSFKGSVTSIQAAQAINRAIKEVNPAIETVQLPMADGGEGTVESILWNRDGKKIKVFAEDPLGREIETLYGWIEKDKMAVIETAAASGLPLVKSGELNPEKASSYGTGQLIAHALDRGANTILLGLGGSASIDAGTGLFEALGMKFFDSKNLELKRIGGRLDEIAVIDDSSLDPRLKKIRLIVACDVSNPLLGKDGAVAVFGPQKGVAENQLDLFEGRMSIFADIAVKSTGRNKVEEAGSGAAGGIGFLLKTFLKTDFRSGLELIVELSELERHLDGAALILTGEGKVDGQSLFGKVPVGIGRLANTKGIPVFVFAGAIGKGAELLEKEGISAILPIVDGPISLVEAMAGGEELLYESTKRLMKILEAAKTIERM